VHMAPLHRQAERRTTEVVHGVWPRMLGQQKRNTVEVPLSRGQVERRDLRAGGGTVARWRLRGDRDAKLAPLGEFK
jgi:hypothetical protein